MLLKIVSQFKGKKVAVLGDIMLDRYLWGEVTRISPEAPVPVVLKKKETFTPGAAANVAANIVSLGGNCDLIGVVGADEASLKLKDELNKRGIRTDMIVTDASRPTTQKTRVMGNRQQLARLDKEKRDAVSGSVEEEIIKKINQIAKDCDAFVISDYVKGLLTPKIAAEVHKVCSQNDIRIVCDGKPQNKELFKNCYLITPNKKEAVAMVGNGKETIEVVGQKLSHKLNCNVLITLSEQGMILIEKNGSIVNIPTKAREVFDVSGAGDTVATATALAIAAKAPLSDACRIGNYAAGVVVGKLGTSIITLKELEEAIISDEK